MVSQLSSWHTVLYQANFQPTDILSGKVKTLSTEAREISAMFSLTASLCYELRDFVDPNGKDKMDELYKMADNFRFMMDNFETEMTLLGGRTALKVYKLLIPQGSRIEEFFKKYGKLIIEAHNVQTQTGVRLRGRSIDFSPFCSIMKL